MRIIRDVSKDTFSQRKQGMHVAIHRLILGIPASSRFSLMLASSSHCTRQARVTPRQPRGDNAYSYRDWSIYLSVGSCADLLEERTLELHAYAQLATMRGMFVYRVFSLPPSVPAAWCPAKPINYAFHYSCSLAIIMYSGWQDPVMLYTGLPAHSAFVCYSELRRRTVYGSGCVSYSIYRLANAVELWE